MSLQKKLLITPRESSGSRSANRFDYQKNWALCKLLEIHSTNNDYLLILDLHEDVIILDSSITPKKASFYQIKTKQAGHWTLNELLRKRRTKKEKSSSILGRLYYNKVIFNEYVNDLSFVSNLDYQVKLEGDKKKKHGQRMLCVNELCDNDKNEILDKLSEELNISKKEIKDNIIFFVISDLSIDSHDLTTIGKLSNFLEKHISQSNYRVGFVYRAIYDEIRKKTNNEISCRNFKDLLEYKSISKKEFDEILKTIKTSFSEIRWIEVSTTLTQEDFPLSERGEIRNAWNSYSIDRMDPNDIVLKKLRKKIINIISNFKNEEKKEEIKNCNELLIKVLKEYQKEKNDDEEIFEKSYLKAIVLMEYFSNGN